MSLQKFLMKLAEKSPAYVDDVKKVGKFGMDQVKKGGNIIAEAPSSALLGAGLGVGGYHAGKMFSDDSEMEAPDEDEILRRILAER